MHEASNEHPSELGFWLRIISNRVSLVLARRLAAKDIGIAEWAFLRLLHGGAAMPPSRMAEAMGLTRSGITRLADRLIGRGLVARAARGGDRRVQLLRLTESGVAVLSELGKLADQNDQDCFPGLSDQDRRALERILRSAAERLIAPITSAR